MAATPIPPIHRREIGFDQRGLEHGARRRTVLIDVMHVLVIYNLALAARVYDVLGRQPTFFVVRRSTWVDPVVLVLVFSLLLPGLLAAAVWLAGFLGNRGRHIFLLVLNGLLTVAFLLPVIKWIDQGLFFDAIDGVQVLVAALVLGGLGAALLCRVAAMRTLLLLLCPLLVLSPGLFLFRVLPVVQTPESAGLDVTIGDPVPVVMVVFDEFCGTSLMDVDRRIDPVRYPHFAALAQEATWFRNCTTTSPSTTEAIPSLLTGQFPKHPSHPPILAEYPRNLFTLLQGRYRLVVNEPITRLCPDELFSPAAAGRPLPWTRGLLIDVAVLTTHILLPRDGPIALIDISGRFGNFVESEQPPESRYRPNRLNPYLNRREQFEDFIHRMNATEEPVLHFAHVMLPHVPWNYLPSGKQYSLPLSREQRSRASTTHGVIGLRRHSEEWEDDEWAVNQAYQRYLLQVSFVDALIGKLVAHLKAIGLYDRSLIVITADHGVSYRPNEARRGLEAGGLEVNPGVNPGYPDIMSIPLLIKAPFQQQGVISDRNVQTADILPTIADVLDVELPWTPDGVSALDAAAAECPVKMISNEEEWEDRLTFDKAFREKYDTLERMLAVFGSGGNSDRLFQIGPHSELCGRGVDEFHLVGEPAFRGELHNTGRLAAIDLNSGYLPCYLGGRIDGRHEDQLPLELAIAVNGTIRATTRTFLVDGLEDTWAALVPEKSFHAGRNQVRVFVVTGSAGEIRLQPIQETAALPD